MAYIPYSEGTILKIPSEKDVWNGFATVPHYGLNRSYTLPHHSSLKDYEPKTIRFDKKGFTAFVDVHLFEKREVSVKIVDHTIIVEGHHDSRDDSHGPIERHFVRKFNLPAEYDMTLLHSTLCNDGVLQLEVPLPETKAERVEREIEVHQTEKPSLFMSLVSNRAHSMLKHSHSVSDEEEVCDEA